jgi:hypothetical protein
MVSNHWKPAIGRSTRQPHCDERAALVALMYWVAASSAHIAGSCRIPSIATLLPARR